MFLVFIAVWLAMTIIFIVNTGGIDTAKITLADVFTCLFGPIFLIFMFLSWLADKCFGRIILVHHHKISIYVQRKT